jgi:hypothetical protein
MGVAVGGRIKQRIFRLPKDSYQKSTAVTFNVQLLNSNFFQRVTGQRPPACPITAADYEAQGLPFFAMFEEPSATSGDFSMVRSVGELGNTTDAPLSKMPLIDVHTGFPAECWECDNCSASNTTTGGRCQHCHGSRKRRGSDIQNGNKSKHIKLGENAAEDPGFVLKLPRKGPKVGFFNPAGPTSDLKFVWEAVDELWDRAMNLGKD